MAAESDRFSLRTGRALGIAGALLGALVVAAFVALLIVGKTYRMPSSSMEPTLHCARPAPGCEAKRSDRFVVLRFLGWGRGDVVVFHTPQAAEARCGVSGTYVKRVIGMPGERVAERGGFLYVDDRRLDEPYIRPDRRDHEPPQTWPRLGKDEVFVVGDNRAQSCDSRAFGPVRKSAVVGRVLFLYWPPHRIGFR